MSDRNQIENKFQQSAAPEGPNPQPVSTDAAYDDAEARTDNVESTTGGEPNDQIQSATAESKTTSAVDLTADPNARTTSESATESEPASGSLPSLNDLERELGNMETLAREVSHQVGDAPEPSENTTPKPRDETDHADVPPGVTTLTPDAVQQSGDARATNGAPPEPETDAAFDGSVQSAATSEGTSPNVQKEQAAEHGLDDVLQGAASADTADADAALSIPDFMKEFTEPETPPPVPEASVTESPEPVAAQASDLVGPPSPAAAVAPDLTSPRPGGPPVDSPMGMPQLAAATKSPDPTAGGDAANARPGRLQSIRAGLSARTLGLADKMADVLEAVDRPFGILGPRVRSIAGWFALATLGTSHIVLIVSLF